MDAAEDRDLLLQRESSSLISELLTSLPNFLFRNDGSPGNGRIRRFVRLSTTVELTNLLEPFQESPQLLDPHLSNLLLPLTEAFLQGLNKEHYSQNEPQKAVTSLVIPLRRGACKLLYTLCKIRGPKTVSRFLQNEPRLLEPMLDAFQESSEGISTVTCMAWEEKYIFMLWLSHLVLTPFDLSSVSSSATTVKQIVLQGLDLPATLPEIATRLLEASAANLGVAGKEREAAVKVLVRICLRPDMLQLKLHEFMIQWAISSLEHWSPSSASTPYEPIGFLSLLGGIVASADAHVVSPFLMRIFECMNRLHSNTNGELAGVTSSAVARKVVIKIYRAICISALQIANTPSALPTPDIAEQVLEEVIDHLLKALADKDTPVRQSASKAISIITIKLESALAADITEAVTGSLDENILWDDASGQIAAFQPKHPDQKTKRIRNLTAVNALRWQGLVLTLSQLLFQRSPPPSQLPPILNSLVIALDFEQRSSSGTSLGTNVRDAACFGVWSIARRYTTDELSAVDTSSIHAVSDESISDIMTTRMSALQILAAELVVAASLDPSGNIRRGASAALQELIGRHPNSITEGISLVQIVDYHAVALRARAFRQVAIEASRLDDVYWSSLLHRMMGWRGVGASDQSSRRLAAQGIGLLASVKGHAGIRVAGASIWNLLSSLRSRDVEKRHGLILALAEVVAASRDLSSDESNADSTRDLLSSFWNVFEYGTMLKDKDFIATTLRPELTAEAVCVLISILGSASASETLLVEKPSQKILDSCVGYVNLSLARQEPVIVACSSTAAKNLLAMSTLEVREALVKQWIVKVKLRTTGIVRAGANAGLLAALGSSYSVFSQDIGPQLQDTILAAILYPLKEDSKSDIENKVAALGSIATVISSSGVISASIILALKICLQDYTTDQRGDIGSLIRLEAVNAVRIAWQHGVAIQETDRTELMGLICSLAAEKLDKVRLQAWSCFRIGWDLYEAEKYGPLSSEFMDVGQTSSLPYYYELLSLLKIDWLRQPLLRGFVTSTGTGSESVLRTSRAALSKYLAKLDSTNLVAFAKSLTTLLRDNLTHERLAVPILDSLAFLLQSNVIMTLKPADFSWRPIFALVQKVHFKSGSIAKLTSAVEVYTGLATVPSDPLIKQEVLRKVASMLLHPFPKVRNTAADALFLHTQSEQLVMVDWSKPVKELKEKAGVVRNEL